MNEYAIKLVRDVTNGTLESKSLEYLKVEVKGSIGQSESTLAYLGFSLICSISCLISSIMFLHYSKQSNSFFSYIVFPGLRVQQEEILEYFLQSEISILCDRLW